MAEISKRIGEKIGYQYLGVKSAKTKNKEKRKKAAFEEANKAIPIPDEEELRVARRRRSRVSSGRSSTILSDDDTGDATLGTEERLGA